jgi:hypothetical protein
LLGSVQLSMSLGSVSCIFFPVSTVSKLYRAVMASWDA